MDPISYSRRDRSGFSSGSGTGMSSNDRVSSWIIRVQRNCRSSFCTDYIKAWCVIVGKVISIRSSGIGSSLEVRPSRRSPRSRGINGYG